MATETTDHRHTWSVALVPSDIAVLGEDIARWHCSKKPNLEAASMARAKQFSGSCLCGATRFSFVGKLDHLYFCHCSQCRKNYGLYGAFAGVDRSAFAMDRAEKLRSYKSSRNVRRSFCGACGSPITWDRKHDERIYVLMGALDGDIRATGAKNIHVKDKGGYYTICD